MNMESTIKNFGLLLWQMFNVLLLILPIYFIVRLTKRYFRNKAEQLEILKSIDETLKNKS